MTTCELHKRIGPYWPEDMTIGKLIDRLYTAGNVGESKIIQEHRLWEGSMSSLSPDMECKLNDAKNRAITEEYYAIMNDDNIPMKMRNDFANDRNVKLIMKDLLP